MQRIRRLRVVLAFACAAAMWCGGAQTADPNPLQENGWGKLVQTSGQALPIPEQWLDTSEARIAHDLRLPPSVQQQPQPFDFDKAWWRSWLPKTPKVAVQYFNHLCSTEAGQWIGKTMPHVEGLYFARPQSDPVAPNAKDDDPLTLPYALEMPWIQRAIRLRGQSLADHGSYFVSPPFLNYRFVEQPRRNVKWQADIREPYIRLFGLTRVPALDQNGKLTTHLKEATPMQVIGIPAITARYGYTWRGILRERDREHGISGGELLIYDLQTKEVLAVRRQFLIGSKNPRGKGKVMWEVAAQCPLPPYRPPGLTEFSQFAIEVLQTIEPSKTGK